MKTEDKSNIKKTSELLLISLIALGISTTTSCGRTTAKPPVTAPVSETPGEPVPKDPVSPGDGDNNGQSDLPQEPTDTPEPLPAPTKPVAPGETIGIKAVGKTTSYILPVGGVKGTYVNIELTWQPVIGAKEYLIYRGAFPPKEQASKNTAYKAVQANGIISTMFIDGVIPPSFSGGNIWDKIKKGFGALTIKPGVEYKYKVFATDEAGTVIGESDSAVTIPLAPVAAPTNIKISETNIVKPLFQWESTSGLAPDGYYVSVHPPISFGKQAAPQGVSFGYAYWSTFRSEKLKAARYGDQSDNVSAYPGTLPFDVSFPLKSSARYSVSITSVKTDTNDMRTAKAISKGWSESKMFVVGVEQPATGTNPVAGTPLTPSPSPSASSEESLWSKIKKSVRSLIGLK